VKPRLASNCDPPASAPSAGITDVHHHTDSHTFLILASKLKNEEKNLKPFF
jgi:hypothetical protein